MSINRAAISGNLTRDAELRMTQGGTQVLSFGVAVNERRRNPQTGEWEDQPSFIDCTLFGRRAQAISQYMRKGAKVAVEGRLHQRSWSDRDTGKRRSAVEVIVDEVEFMGSRQGAQQPQQAPQAYQAAPQYPRQAPAPQAPAYAPQPAPQAYQAPQQAPAPAQQPPAMDVYDEDIPF